METEASKVQYLLSSVESTDRRLEHLNFKVERFGRAVSRVSLGGDDNEDGPMEEDEAIVMDLLNDVTQVKEDYEQLRTDIVEIQQLQRELSSCLRNQLNQVHAKYGCLRQKLGPALPSGLQMNANCRQPSPLRYSASSSNRNARNKFKN